MADNDDVTATLVMADFAVSGGDYGKALQLLRKALNQIDGSPSASPKQRLEILMKLSEVNEILGQWVDALMYLDNAFHTASEMNIRGIMAEAQLASGTILSKKGEWDIAQRKFKQAISFVGPGNHGTIMARALVGEGIIFWRRGEGNQAIRLAKKALSLAEDKSEEDIMGSANALIGCAAFDMGDYSLSLDSNEKALAHFRKTNNTVEIARVLNNTGETYKVMGDYNKALEFFNQGLELPASGAPRSAGYLLTNIAECHARQGRAADARTFAHTAGGKIADVQDDYLHAMLSFVWALIYESEEDTPRASESFLSALGKMQSLGIPFDTGMIQMAYGRFLSNQKKTEEAIKHLEDAKLSFRKAGSQPLAQQVERDIARLSE